MKSAKLRDLRNVGLVTLGIMELFHSMGKPYSWGPQPWAKGLLRTGPHNRGEQWVSKQGFLCIYSKPPAPQSLTLQPQLHLLSDQQRHNTCNAFESSPEHTATPMSVKKLSSVKLVPSAKMVGDCCHGRLWAYESGLPGIESWPRALFASALGELLLSHVFISGFIWTSCLQVSPSSSLKGGRSWFLLHRILTVPTSKNQPRNKSKSLIILRKSSWKLWLNSS